jgi:ElaB/YqjD/DUF883 family membrane-anchored ribosome-binding protein
MSNENRQSGSSGSVAVDKSTGYKRESGDGAGVNVDQYRDRLDTTADDLKDKAAPRTDDFKDKANEYKDKVSETASEYGDKAQEQLEKGKEQTASGLESAAGMIRERTQTGPLPPEAGAKVAEGMESAATYLREHDTTEIWNDMERYVKEHPAQAVAGAIFAGFLLGRMLR